MTHDTSGSPARRNLLASVHDASPLYLEEVEILRERLARHVHPSRIAMLVIPDHWRQARIREGTAFASSLRRWVDEGSEIFLHGWAHLDNGNEKPATDRLKARFMTAREGEFLGLGKREALRLLRDGKALLEDIAGRSVAGFIAPAWLYDDSARDAIAELGFPLCEDHFRVWEPATGRRLARGPVVTWASRSWLRAQSSVGFAALARHALEPLRTVRLAVHPCDIFRTEINESIDATIRRFTRDRVPIRYADLLASRPVQAIRPSLTVS